MLNIDELGKDFQTLEECRAYIEAQKKQIASLSKKIKLLEDDNKELKRKPLVIKEENHSLQAPTSMILKSDVETISQVQLKLLKEISFERELTLDETKRCEIFNKILLSRQENKNSSIPGEGREVTDAELLSIVALNGTK